MLENIALGRGDLDDARETGENVGMVVGEGVRDGVEAGAGDLLDEEAAGVSSTRKMSSLR